MITVTDRILNIPPNEKNIGFVGDNLVEIRQFVITDSRLFQYTIELDLKKASGAKGIGYTERKNSRWEINYNMDY